MRCADDEMSGFLLLTSYCPMRRMKLEPMKPGHSKQEGSANVEYDTAKMTCQMTMRHNMGR